MNNNSFLYGRARRIALMEVVGFILLSIAVILLIVFLVFKEDKVAVKNEKFSLLTNYFAERHYTCEVLSHSGGKCVLSTEGKKYSFYRYDDGFQYIIRSNSYTLAIVHRLTEEDEITFKTTSEAFDGYKNQTFECQFEDNVLGKVTSCHSSKDDIDLDVNSYLGVIEQAQDDINQALASSGYSIDDVIINYEWNKK